MGTELRLDPELAAVVERSRRRARELGELPRPLAAAPDAAVISKRPGRSSPAGFVTAATRPQSPP